MSETCARLMLPQKFERRRRHHTLQTHRKLVYRAPAGRGPGEKSRLLLSFISPLISCLHSSPSLSAQFAQVLCLSVRPYPSESGGVGPHPAGSFDDRHAGATSPQPQRQGSSGKIITAGRRFSAATAANQTSLCDSVVDGPLCASPVRHLMACKQSQLPSGVLAFCVSEPCKDMRKMFVQIKVLYGFRFIDC